MLAEKWGWLEFTGSERPCLGHALHVHSCALLISPVSIGGFGVGLAVRGRFESFQVQDRCRHSKGNAILAASERKRTIEHVSAGSLAQQ